MRQLNDFMTDMADLDQHPEGILWRALSPTEVREEKGKVLLTIPFAPFSLQGSLKPLEGEAPRIKTLTLEAPGSEILHLYDTHRNSVMLDYHKTLAPETLSVQEEEARWVIRNSAGSLRASFEKERTPVEGWSDLIRPAFDSLRGSLFPDGKVKAALSGEDQFFPEKVESLPLAYLTYTEAGEERGAGLFSFQAAHDEHFAGTGERFAAMDLKGKTLVLDNTDGLGVNSRRAYKNVPFFLSSRGYGLFMHTSFEVRLSLADISTRAAQGRMDEENLDLFIIGGGAPEPVLKNYRKLTGFPPQLPLWSYGTWMSRMTYFSADEIEEICSRMRREEYPCDMIHIDTGWFETDWVCEWTFSPERFPDPAGFMKKLRNQGYRVSLWQTPNIGEGNKLLEEAKAKRYLAPPRSKGVKTSSDFSGQDFGGQIDFTNPEAVAWYKSMIRDLMEKGASVIKTDFGEKIQMDADYLGMSPRELHNLYGLFYQKAAFEETEDATGEGIIWARAGWAGCQRYPLHWGGDAAATWDGLAASIRGGIHIGLSGFGFWSHDVPGFHGIPEFMNTLPTDNLYMRWTQFGVFSSHLRYHGTSPREPWHYPAITDHIRKWLRLRYHLIPYFMKQAEKVSRSGSPVLQAMVFQFPEDPVCWHLDDQFFCGEDFLAAPVINDSHERKVYLPEGEWIDFWTGEAFSGPRWVEHKEIPLDQMPLYCRKGATIPVYPEPVLTTDEMDLKKTIALVMDDSFSGWLNTDHARKLGW